MVRVVLTNELGQRFAGGDTTLDLDVKTIGALIRALDRRYPGIGEIIRNESAIAIDGQIFQDALYEPIGPDSEVYFVRAIRGG